MRASFLLAWLRWRSAFAGNVLGSYNQEPQAWHSSSVPRAVQRAGNCHAGLAFALVDATYAALVEAGFLEAADEHERDVYPSVGQAVSCSTGARCFGDDSPEVLLRAIRRGLASKASWRYGGSYQLWDPRRHGSAPPCRPPPQERLALPTHASHLSIVRPMNGEEDQRVEFMETLMEHGAVVTRIFSPFDEAETKRLLDTSSVVDEKTIDAFEDALPLHRVWVLLCGWGEGDVAPPHWTVKGSWGPAWAAGGYLMVQRYRTSMGIAKADVNSGLPFALRVQSVSSWYPPWAHAHPVTAAAAA